MTQNNSSSNTNLSGTAETKRGGIEDDLDTLLNEALEEFKSLIDDFIQAGKEENGIKPQNDNLLSSPEEVPRFENWTGQSIDVFENLDINEK